MRPMAVASDGKDRASLSTRQLFFTAVRKQAPLWTLAGVLMLVGLLVSYESSIQQTPQELLDNGIALRRPCVSRIGSNPKPFTSLKLDSLNFLAVGDWGLDTEPKEEYGDQSAWDVPELKRVSKAMSEWAGNRNSGFVANVGDSFYQYGISDPHSSRWHSTFDQVFESNVLKNMYWYSVLGNHDWKANYMDKSTDLLRGNTRDEKVTHGAFSQLHHTLSHTNLFRRWCMPSLNYTVDFSLEGEARSENGNHGEEESLFHVRLVAFDSQVLIKRDPDAGTGAYDLPGVPSKESMLEWLEEALCKYSTKDTWLITMSHHFVASVGNYFQDPHFGVMQNDVLNIMQRCGVRLHLHGHDHITQVLRLPSGILQVGVGSAGKTNGNIKANSEQLREDMGTDYKLEYATIQAAFADVQVSKDELVVKLINSSGEVLSTSTVDRLQ